MATSPVTLEDSGVGGIVEGVQGAGTSRPNLARQQPTVPRREQRPVHQRPTWSNYRLSRMTKKAGIAAGTTTKARYTGVSIMGNNGVPVQNISERHASRLTRPGPPPHRPAHWEVTPPAAVAASGPELLTVSGRYDDHRAGSVPGDQRADRPLHEPAEAACSARADDKDLRVAGRVDELFDRRS
jgi:hypothetical protein